MIQLICTHCRAMLEMDDGFAGGACRCVHCGTIQTVPSHLKNKATAAKPARTLYQSKPEGAAPSSGLDQLADVVASSGLTSSRLRTPRITATVETKTKPAPKNVKTLLIGAAVLILVLCSALIYVIMHARGGASAPRPEAAAAAVPRRASPDFSGIPLTGDTIIYVLDRGDSTRASFDSLKSLTLKSLRSLGEKREFQLVFWNNGKDLSYPGNWPIYATPENIDGAQRAMDEITPHGKSDVKSALKNAIAANPTDIVLVTGKAWDLDDGFVSAVEQIRGDKEVRIHTVSLGDPGTSTALQAVAARTHGSFKAVAAGN